MLNAGKMPLTATTLVTFKLEPPKVNKPIGVPPGLKIVRDGVKEGMLEPNIPERASAIALITKQTVDITYVLIRDCSTK